MEYDYEHDNNNIAQHSILYRCLVAMYTVCITIYGGKQRYSECV